MVVVVVLGSVVVVVVVVVVVLLGTVVVVVVVVVVELLGAALAPVAVSPTTDSIIAGARIDAMVAPYRRRRCPSNDAGSGVGRQDMVQETSADTPRTDVSARSVRE